MTSSQQLILLISVQHECIPQAILGMDVICQAKSGMGKTAVFVLATLQQIEPTEGQVGLIYRYITILNALYSQTLSNDIENRSSCLEKTYVANDVLNVIRRLTSTDQDQYKQIGRYQTNNNCCPDSFLVTLNRIKCNVLFGLVGLLHCAVSHSRVGIPD